MYNISEKSKLYSEKNISKEEVYKLLSNDFSQFQIDMLFADKTESLIETKEVYDFICENKDLTKKEINVILNDDVKLFLRIHTHKGTWYSDDYVPYCGQMQVKCSSPRMQLTDYGNKCPECGNEIGLSGVRLTDSPLNKSPNMLHLAGRYALAGNGGFVVSSDKTHIPNNSQLEEIHKNRLVENIENNLNMTANEISNVAVFGRNSEIPVEYPDGLQIYQNPNLEPNFPPISMIHNIVITKDKYLQLDKLSKEGSYGNKLTKFNLVEDLLLLEDNSITDSNLIRAIALWSIENNSNMLNSKIKSEMTFAGLYPNVMKSVSYDEVVENPEFKELVESITESGRNNIQMLKDAFEQKPIDDWVPLDQMLEHFKNSETNINFRVDTRDFHCIKSVKDNFSKLSHHTQHTIPKYFKRFTYSRDEVINVLQTAFEKSGGKGEWRMLSYIKYPNETNSWQLKYLNVIYVGDKYTDLEGKYIITDGDKDSHRLLNKDMWYTEIDEELLCHH